MELFPLPHRKPRDGAACPNSYDSARSENDAGGADGLAAGAEARVAGEQVAV
jgi:hypothetical protein